MSKILVLYYSSYGHIEAIARAVAEGARSAGASVDIKRVPETASSMAAVMAEFEPDLDTPVATVTDLDEYDAIVVGCPTRFGCMPSQMTSFLYQAGCQGARGALNGKVGGVFTSTAGQPLGQEVTLFSMITNLLYFGMVVVGLPYCYQGQMSVEEIVGVRPNVNVLTSIASNRGQRDPCALELGGARQQGKLIAETAGKLFDC